MKSALIAHLNYSCVLLLVHLFDSRVVSSSRHASSPEMDPLADANVFSLFQSAN
uniref:Secreted protein n=1 Tax=Ascaris lumbricoides TaxID=6252 RepID=A0A0M3IED6_ASCLU